MVYQARGNVVMKSKTIQWVASLLIGIIVMVLLFRFVEWNKVKEILSRASIGLLLIGLLINVIGLIIKGIRWQLLLSSHQHIPIKQAINLTIVGFFGNAFLPARGGDIGRALLLAQNKSISKVYCLTTVTLDKAMDFFSLLLIIAPIPLLLPLPKVLQKAMVISISAGILIFIMAFIYARKTRLTKPTGQEGRFKRILLNIGLGLQIITKPQIFFKAYLLSIISWLLQVYLLILVAQAIGVHLLVGQSVMTLLGQNIAVLIPGPPSDLGTLHASITFMLYLFGYNKEIGMGIAILYHIVIITPLVVLGPILINQFGFKMFKKDTKNND